MTLRRYALFTGTSYYPLGGWGDFQDSFAELDEALRVGKESIALACDRWYEVVDLTTAEVVAQGDSG